LVRLHFLIIIAILQITELIDAFFMIISDGSVRIEGIKGRIEKLILSIDWSVSDERISKNPHLAHLADIDS
jgi:hypothetical protein